MSMVRCAPALVKLGAWRTVWQMGGKYIAAERLRRVCSFQPLLGGGSPFNTTSIYSLIHYLEREYGVHFAMGGTTAIVDALSRLMAEQAVNIILGQEVFHINVAGGSKTKRQRAVGLETSSGNALHCDLVA